MSTKNNIFSDKKINKSLLNLKYLAYIFLIVVIVLGFGVTTFYGAGIVGEYPDMKLQVILWLVIFYIISCMIIWGIKDVLKMLTNLSEGNVFTVENAKLLKVIDKKLLFTLFFSIIVNIIMTIANLHFLGLLIIWIVFISFILAAHVLVKPLSLLVEKSAEMKLEMDLTI